MVKVAGYDNAQGQGWKNLTNYTLDDTILHTTGYSNIKICKYMHSIQYESYCMGLHISEEIMTAVNGGTTVLDLGAYIQQL